MNKILSVSSAILLTAVAVTAAMDWDQVSNLVPQGATVTVSSKPGEAQNITDHNDGTRWQAIGGANKYANDWAIIDLGEETTFTDIEIKWEASHPTAYSVYVSTSEIPYAETTFNKGTEEAPDNVTYNVIDAEWLNSNEPAVTGGTDGESGFTDNLVISATTARYILIYCTAYNGYATAYGSSIFEVRVANIEGRDDVTSLSVSSASVAEGESTDVTVTALSTVGTALSLDKVTNLQLTCSDAEGVEISGGENGVFSVKGLKIGEYTLTATAQYGETTVTGSATFVVNYNWSKVTNIATGKTTTARLKDADATNEHPASNATDGDEDTYYTYDGEWAGGESWVIVDLGKDYLISAVSVSYGANSGGKYRLSFGEDGAAQPEADLKWTDNNVLSGWTSTSSFDRTANAVSNYIPTDVVKARYVAVRDADNPNGKPQVKEIYISGEEYAAPIATTLELSASQTALFPGETADLSCSIKDQYGQEMTTTDTPEYTVTGATIADGVVTATAKGTIEVSATLAGLTATTQLYVASQSDYCMADATVTSDNETANGAYAIDGGADPTGLGNTYVVTDNESAGEHEHWILAELAKPYDLDMIIAIWEGACPADYDVYVGETADNLVKLYSVTGHTQQNWYDRFAGQPMKNVRYIKLVTTKNATVYGIKLHDLKAYGTSNAILTATSIELSASTDNVSTDESVTISASVLDQYGSAMPDAQATLSVDNNGTISDSNVFTTSRVGTYTVTATYGELTETLSINVVANSSDKLDLATAATAKLGNTAVTLGQEIQFPELNVPLIISFAKPYNFTLIKLRWEAACPSDYTVTAIYNDATTATILAVAGRSFVGGFNPTDRIWNLSDDTTQQEGKQRSNATASASLKNITGLEILPTAKDHIYTLRLLGIDTYGTESNEIAANADITIADNADAMVNVYSLTGILLRSNVARTDALKDLPKGIYIVGGKKVVK
jgi:hypothetical protein